MVGISFGAVVNFVRESNMIEGIRREPTYVEVAETRSFLLVPLQMASVLCLQATYAPGCPLRDEPGMNVRVGSYVAPAGGPGIRRALDHLVQSVAIRDDLSRLWGDPWLVHCEFETLHPFMDGNGRTGRALWARHMLLLGHDPFEIPFLRRFYYQTLAHSDGRIGAPAT